MGSIDKVTTSKLKKKEKRQYECCIEKKQKMSGCETEVDVLDTESGSDDKTDDHNFSSSEFSSEESSSCIRNLKKYPELCKAVDRCKVSNRDACLLANALLKDLELLSPATAIDPAKLRRQRKYWRQKEVDRHSMDVNELICLGFDGKQDLTLTKSGGGEM
jgi:hypothetical protein